MSSLKQQGGTAYSYVLTNYKVYSTIMIRIVLLLNQR